ncbi:MAG: hypothetical protein ACK587_08425 [Cyanobacteriota bacterium]
MMAWQLPDDGMDGETDLASEGLLPPLSLVDMETLLAALDPRLDGFGSGPSCLDDALAFLARLASGGSGSGGSGGGEAGPVAMMKAMEEWIEIWRSAGGNRQTLRLMVQTLMAERLGRTNTQTPGAQTGGVA